MLKRLITSLAAACAVAVTATAALPLPRHSLALVDTHRANPRLRRVAFAGGLDSAIWKPVFGVAVSRSGRIAATSDVAPAPKEGYILQIISPLSDTLITVARKGDGPGELSGDDQPFADGDTFHIFDLKRRVQVIYSATGKFVGENRPQATPADYIIGFAGDSVDFQALPTSPTQVPSLPQRRRIGEASARPLLVANDSFLRRMTLPVATGGLLGGPRYAISEKAIAAGDPMSYTINVYGVGGDLRYRIHRALPQNFRSPTEIASIRKALAASLGEGRGGPAALTATKNRLDTLARETIGYFAQAGLQFDGRGRLWVVGPAGDSTFADVFSDGKFVARQMLACTHPGRRIAMQGTWLALDCERPGHDAPFLLQLYAIE